jgi:putative beta-lysine N-acetyltransferase
MLTKYNLSESHLILDNTKLILDWPNKRMKILTYENLTNNTFKHIKNLAAETELDKIIAYVPSAYQELLLEEGFILEGIVKNFFAGIDAFCFSFFVSQQRKISDNIYHGISPAGADWDHWIQSNTQSKLSYITRNASEKDIPGMISLFKSVFDTYPSPVFDTAYLQTNIKTKKVTYNLAVYNNNIIGIASADKDKFNLNAEITDCVTDSKFRGQGILNNLIIQLEKALYKEGFICLYTLCRANQAAVNKAFFRQGYSFSGRLIKNCNICGSFEDMNILVKVIR